MKKVVLLVLTCLGFLTVPVWAEEGIRQERVQFQQGRDSASLKGRIKGDETVDYQLGARAGQTMAVTLKSSNRFTYFNILPPGDDTAIFVGSTSGNHFSGTLPTNGDYTVRVYLMRNAARRNETANYSLNIHIGGGQHASRATTGGGDFADGDAGGPDFWEVTGVPGGDTLNMRAGPSAREPVVGDLGNGAIVRNLGCKTASGQRWCQVAMRDEPSRRGWVAGRYLRESSYQQGGHTGGVPEVAPRPSGEVEVRMPSGCTALYDNRGSLITRGSSCSSSDRRRADDAATTYFREQGLGGGVSHEGGGEPPQIFAGANGEGEVVFKNDCVVYYDRSGRRKDALSKCHRNQLMQADQAMAAYRREQGL